MNKQKMTAFCIASFVLTVGINIMVTVAVAKETVARDVQPVVCSIMQTGGEAYISCDVPYEVKTQ